VAFIVALYDACVLHDSLVRDLLIRVATKRSLNVRARWSQQILDEMVQSILERRPDIDPRGLDRTRQLMCDAVPDCLVSEYETLTEGIHLPDPDDRHVLAAAIKGGADVIVTYNMRHFPSATLLPFNIEPQHPDEFLVSLLDLDTATVREIFVELVADLRKSQLTSAEAAARLRDRGLIRAAQRLG
jgi:predicted nucleic acid-binding protein